MGHDGARVRVGYDEEDALKLTAERQPDLILLDVMLPSRDGWSVCRALQANERTRDIDIIVFTARGSREDYDTAQTFPAIRGYFVKPYMTDDVLRHVEKISRRERLA